MVFIMKNIAYSHVCVSNPKYTTLANKKKLTKKERQFESRLHTADTRSGYIRWGAGGGGHLGR